MRLRHGPALNIAASSGAYALADRGTWLNFKNRADLAILVEGDARLFNQYGVMVVKPKHAHVKAQDAQKFVDWIVSPTGQAVIASYKIGGEQLFFPTRENSGVPTARHSNVWGVSSPMLGGWCCRAVPRSSRHTCAAWRLRG